MDELGKPGLLADTKEKAVETENEGREKQGRGWAKMKGANIGQCGAQCRHLLSVVHASKPLSFPSPTLSHSQDIDGGYTVLREASSWLWVVISPCYSVS